MSKFKQTIIITNDHTMVSFQDRGLNYGDGFFTTARINDASIEHWPLHKARLIECAARLAFPTLDVMAIENASLQAIGDMQSGILKIVITRGSGGRGYGLPEAPSIQVLITVLPAVAHYKTWQEQGVSLAISSIKLAHQPVLAGLKTLNRLEQVLIKNQMNTLNCDDVVVLDINDNVIESSAANLFAIKNEQIFSPQLNNCGITGVYLKSLCAKLAIEFKQISVEELLAMDAVFMCNSLMGVVPVAAITDTQFDITRSKALLATQLAKENV
ncbi:aminodeoxychorismate lyase [Pseudoalteromonas lipolytica]